MGGLSWWHWLLIVLAFVVLFGAKRLPDAARGLGRSMRILKSEVSEMHKDGDEPPPAVVPVPAAPVAAVPAAAVPVAAAPVAAVPVAAVPVAAPVGVPTGAATAPVGVVPVTPVVPSAAGGIAPAGAATADPVPVAPRQAS